MYKTCLANFTNIEVYMINNMTDYYEQQAMKNQGEEQGTKLWGRLQKQNSQLRRRSVHVSIYFFNTV